MRSTLSLFLVPLLATGCPNSTSGGDGAGREGGGQRELGSVSESRPPSAEAGGKDLKPDQPAIGPDLAAKKDLPPSKESNCSDGKDNDGDLLVDCKDPDCPPCPPSCPAGQECCDGIDNNGNGKIDEGNVCAGVGEPCPPGAYQICDCYCGVHRKCKSDGTWGPCFVNNSCQPATTTTQAPCGSGYCDYGKCVPSAVGIGTQCKHHTDCSAGKVCDLGYCIADPYAPWKCP